MSQGKKISRVNSIIPNPEQPRKILDQADLKSLAGSLKDNGLLNPIAVEGPHEGIYVLVAIEAMRKEIKTLNFDANLHEKFGADYPAAVNASRRRRELRNAIEALSVNAGITLR